MAGFKDTVSKSFTTINLKTSNFVAVNRIRTYITTLESEISGLKAEIGRRVYDEWAEKGSFEQADITALCEQVKEKQALIEEQQGQIKEVERQEQAILGKKEAAGADVPAPEDVKFCGECGAANMKNFKFCQKCGTPL